MVDNLITLYEANVRNFSTNGLGSLNKAISCVVVERRNGEYELELVYPVDFNEEDGDSKLLDDSRYFVNDYSGNDIYIKTKPLIYKEIKFNRIIVAKPNPYSTPQAFRIYSISKPIDGQMTVNAQHISYDLSGVSVSPFTASSCANALTEIKSKSVGFCPFTFWTDIVSANTMGFKVPMSMRSILGGTEGSILDTYGGEYEFDNFTVKLHNNRGSNRGVTIRYGKNLTDILQEENCSEVYTEVYSYYYYETDEGSELVELPEKTVKLEGTFDHTKVLTVDLTEYFEDKPTTDELRYVTQAYINAYNIGVPDISLTVSFAPLSQTTEYKDYALLEKVNLCDTVNVEFSKMGISATAKCIATKYDVLADKYISIDLGNARSDLTTTFQSYNEVIKDLPTKTFLEEAIENATNLITGQNGGYVVMNPSVQPRELLIMDQPTIESATKVWRWNAGGLGYSSNGYNGPYQLAMTMDGSIVADFVNTGTLNANLIKAGMLSDFNNTNYWDLTAGKALFTNLKVKQSMTLVDENNFRRASIAYDSNYGSGLWFYNGKSQRSMIYLGVPRFDNPNVSYPVIALGDSNGAQLSTISANSDGGSLHLDNVNGRQMVSLYGNMNGGILLIKNEYNKNSIYAHCDSNSNGRIAVYDSNGTQIGTIFSYNDHGAVSIGDSDGNQLATMSGNSDGGYLQIINKRGTICSSLKCGLYGGMAEIKDNNGNQRIVLGVNNSGEGHLNVDGNIYGNYLGKKWVTTSDYFDSIDVNRTWENIYCSLAQQVDYTEFGITNLEHAQISLVTMNGGMWAWPVITEQDDQYLYYVLARPSSDTCLDVRVDLLLIGT